MAQQPTSNPDMNEAITQAQANRGPEPTPPLPEYEFKAPDIGARVPPLTPEVSKPPVVAEPGSDWYPKLPEDSASTQ